MLHSSLFTPDDVSWHDEMGYSKDVGEVLRAAYTLIKQQSDYAGAAELVRTFEHAEMSDQQSMRVQFVLGLAAIARDDLQATLHYLAQVEAYASQLGDSETLIMLAQLQAKHMHEGQQFNDALQYNQVVLEWLQERAAEAQESYDGDMLDTLKDTANGFFLQGMFDEASSCVEQMEKIAKHVEPTSENRRLWAASQWMRALIARWNDDPHAAERYAELAESTYADLELPGQLARLCIVLADIELDLAETAPLTGPSQTRRKYLMSAESHLGNAFALNKPIADEHAEGMAILARVRYERISNMSMDRLPTLQITLDLAHRINDKLLIAQTHTAFGDEFVYRGDYTAARAHYQTALVVYDQSQAPALAKWAKRSLLRLDEFHPAPPDSGELSNDDWHEKP